jgi:ABC-type Zn uptake system ZnuABC Zn-binding protein ZnuA
MRYSGFQLDAETGAKIVTVTTDGKIHRIDAMTGTIEASLEVVTPFVFRTRVPRPGLAVAHQMAYVTDPASGEVVEVNLEEMTISRRFVTDGKPVRLAVIGLLEKEEHGEEHADHEHGMFDPHVWHDVKNVRQMVTNIRDALIRADAPNADTYRANAAAYLKQLDELDKFVVSEVAKIPAERRLLVTAHNTFSYFAERYGFKVVGTALGTTTDMADPAAGQLAELVKEIKESGVVAIFPENVSNTRLMEQIAREAGVKLAPPLITDALDTPGTPGDTYIGMIRYNVTTMVEALR